MGFLNSRIRIKLIFVKNPFKRISSRDLKDKDNGYGNVLSEIEETCSKP